MDKLKPMNNLKIVDLLALLCQREYLIVCFLHWPPTMQHLLAYTEEMRLTVCSMG